MEDCFLTQELWPAQGYFISLHFGKGGLVAELNLCGSLHARDCDLAMSVMCDRNKIIFSNMDIHLVF